jgi:hypothetical protein
MLTMSDYEIDQVYGGAHIAFDYAICAVGLVALPASLPAATATGAGLGAWALGALGWGQACSNAASHAVHGGDPPTGKNANVKPK